MKKHTIIILMVLVTTVFSLNTNVNAQTIIKFSDVKNNVLEQYKNDEQFKLEMKENPDGAMQMINSITLEKLRPSRKAPRIGGMTGAVCTVPVIKQATDFYCGYATMLQTLYGINLQSKVSGTDNNRKQETLAENAGHKNSSAIVWEVKRDLNTYLSQNYYKYMQGSAMDKSSFATKIYNSLYYNRPVLLHAKTKSLPYYHGRDLGHYLSVDKIDCEPIDNLVRIKDCCWYDQFRGEWNVRLSEAYGTVSPSGRYVIYY
ncbi:hypothetical protein [Vallitalea sp.]|uniref:hypothetical protein n=1 Tax=Vallitalea sp. TaxID=1882829 RepID=UPI0025FE5281|nr:hypothetical protein [Vallitalea sp.]MCT4688356.1 hypothetical protein [Vallitalea sp.]